MHDLLRRGGGPRGAAVWPRGVLQVVRDQGVCAAAEPVLRLPHAPHGSGQGVSGHSYRRGIRRIVAARARSVCEGRLQRARPASRGTAGRCASAVEAWQHGRAPPPALGQCVRVHVGEDLLDGVAVCLGMPHR